MRKLWAGLLIVAMMVLASTSAGAISADAKDLCTFTAAVTSSRNGHVVNAHLYRTLVHSSDSALRDAGQSLAKNAKDRAALSDLGSWCKAHMPKSRVVQRSDFAY